jgi:hypothetical protein
MDGMEQGTILVRVLMIPSIRDRWSVVPVRDLVTGWVDGCFGAKHCCILLGEEEEQRAALPPFWWQIVLLARRKDTTVLAGTSIDRSIHPAKNKNAMPCIDDRVA